MGKLCNNSAMTIAQILQVTPTITAGLYAAGNAVGTMQTLSNICQAAVSNGGAVLTDVTVVDKSNQKPPLSLLFYSAPLTVTITDKATPVLKTDIANLRGRVDVAAADYTTFGSDSVAIAQEKNLGILLENTESNPSIDNRGISSTGGMVSRNLYLVILTTGTPTFVSTSDLTLNLKFSPVF